VQVLSIKYSLCPILKFIIPSRSPVVETSINDTININQMKENPLLYWVHPQILIRVHIWRVEPILHIDNCLQSLFKARQCLSLWWVHHFCQDQYFFLVFSYSFEPLEEVFFEVFEEEGAFASKYTHVVAKKLEGNWLFELEFTTWGIREQESKINVEDVACLLIK